MLKNNLINEQDDTVTKDSLTRQEEAYINSPEYQSIYREKNWMVIGLIMTELAGLLIWVLV
jgi:hypothetical protein